MIANLKRYWYQKDLQSHQNYSYKPELRTYNTGESIGVVSSLQHREYVKAFVANSGSTNAFTLYYSEQASELPNSYSKKDLKWHGVPHGEAVTSFLEREYDRLFFVDTKMDPHQQYICRLAKCRFSIGPLLVGDHEAFDLSIQLDGMSIDHLTKEMKKGIDLLSHLS